MRKITVRRAYNGEKVRLVGQPQVYKVTHYPERTVLYPIEPQYTAFSLYPPGTPDFDHYWDTEVEVFGEY